MSEDPSDRDDLEPIPEYPGQDPDAAEPGPWTDGYGLSGTLDSGYEIDRSQDARRAEASASSAADDDETERDDAADDDELT